jgi:hypothetical protein
MGCDVAIGFQPPDDDVTVCTCAIPHLQQQANMGHQPKAELEQRLPWSAATDH